MRLKLALVLLCGVFGLCLAVSADDRREGRRSEREDERRREEKPLAAVPVAVKADKVPSYKNDVAPLLRDACANCHGGRRRKAGLDVTSYDSLMKFVKPGNPDQSKLHKSLLGKGAKPMPPKNPLAGDQIDLIKAWIAAGAKKD